MLRGFNEITNRKVRVFVSSTFSDMQEERERIVNSIFPRLRKDFAAELIDIVCIDLRWGLPENLSETGKIIDLCLGEVLKCKPFFLGIIGKRYGYTPSQYEINNTSNYIKTILGNDGLVGLSITEMEIIAGKSDPNNISYSSFHLKEGIFTDDKNILSLREKIKRDYKNNTEFYSSLNQFEEQVYVKLKSQIRHYFPPLSDYPYNDQTYYSHLNLLKKYINNYEPNISNIHTIINTPWKNNCKLIIGEKGSGKSALIGYITQQLANSEENVFFHFVSAGGDSACIDNIFSRIIKYLEEINKTQINIIDNDYEKTLREYLSKTTFNKPIYLIIDSLNQVEGNINSQHIFSSIATLNPNIYILCTDEDIQTAWLGNSYQIHSLTKKQIKKIVSNILTKNYGKQLNEFQIKAIQNNKLSRNPMFLTTLIEELRVFGSFENFNNYFKSVVSACNLNQLFRLTYGRLKKYCEDIQLSPNIIENIFSLLIYSRKGMSEMEIMEIEKISAFAWAPIYSTLENFTTEENGLIKISNKEIINTILQILDEKEQIIGKIGFFKKRATIKLIRFFSNSQIENRKDIELPHIYKMRGNPVLLAKIITDEKAFSHIYSADFHALIGYYASVHKYENYLQKILLKKLTNFISSNLIINLAQILCSAGCYRTCIKIVDTALNFAALNTTRISLLSEQARSEYKLGTNKYFDAIKSYKKLISEYSRLYPNNDVGLCEHLLKYGIALASQGDFYKARDVYMKIISTYHKENIIDGVSSWAEGNLGNVLFRIGENKKAIQLFEKAIINRKFLYGDNSNEVAWEYCYALAPLLSDGNYKKSIEIAETAVNIYRHHFNDTGMELAWALLNLGNAYLLSENYEQCISPYERSISINNSVLPPNKRPHPYSLTGMNNLAVFSYISGKHDESLKQFNDILKYKIEKVGDNHPYSANTHLNIANTNIGDNKTILYHYNKALEIYSEKIGENSPDFLLASICLAIFYLNQEKIAEAKKVIDGITLFINENEIDKHTDYLYLQVKSAIYKKSFTIPKKMLKFQNIKALLSRCNESEIILLPKLKL